MDSIEKDMKNITKPPKSTKKNETVKNNRKSLIKVNITLHL
jgi:hypothetical protein